MSTLTGTPVPESPPQEAADKVEQWANEYLERITEETEKRLSEIAHVSNGSHNGGPRPKIGEPTVGLYVAFDVAMTSPIQPGSLPPYLPSKVIAAGEPAFLVAFTFVNPMISVPDGFAVQPTVQLGGRHWRVTLDLTNITKLTHENIVVPGVYGPVAQTYMPVVFPLLSDVLPDPGPDPDVYEANVTFDISDPAQPYAAFATSFYDYDLDPGFMFVPPSPPGWRHELPNRFIVYRK